VDALFARPATAVPGTLVLLYGAFQLVYGIGGAAGNAVAWALAVARARWLEPALATFPPLIAGLLGDGLYQGAATLLGVLPVIVLFLIVMSVLSDSGLLARVAAAAAPAASRLGLDGHALALQIMGLGCNVPAVLAARGIPDGRRRNLALRVVPFSPCSARLQVMVFVTAAVYSPAVAPLVLLSLYGVALLAAAFTALVHRGKTAPLPPPPLPPLRLPSATAVAARAGTELAGFLARSGPLLLLGVLAVWALIHLPWGLAPGAPGTYAENLARALAPVLDPVGIEHGLALALLFGLVAKEVVLGGLAVVYGATAAGLPGLVAAHLDGVHAYSFLLFVLIYTPCLSTVAAVRRASASWRETMISILWPLGLAWGVSFLFYQAAQLVTRQLF